MTPQNDKLHKQLRLVSWLATLDAILLVLLVSAAIFHAQPWVHVLGPVHGINFLCLMAAVTLPAVDGQWGWWFPILVFFTGGPIGAFIGERRIVRSQLRENSSQIARPQNDLVATTEDAL